MSRLVKIVLIVVVAILVIVFGGLALAATFIDPNDYRGKVTELVKKQTGRDLTLGNIELGIFPWLNVKVDDVRFSNAEGFGDKPMASASEAAVGVQLLPLLLRREVEVSTVTLRDLELDLAKDAQGRSNWDDLLKASTEDPATGPEDESSEGKGVESIDIAGVVLSNASIRYRDAQADQEYTLEKVNLETGNLRPGQPIDVDASLSASSKAQGLAADIALQATVLADMIEQSMRVSGLNLKVDATGDALKGSVNLAGEVLGNLETQVFDVSGLELDFDTEMPDMAARGKLAGTVQAALNAQKLKLDGLSLNVDATGKSIPGGQQSLRLSGNADYDMASGALNFKDGKISAAGLDVTTSISGTGLNGDNPKLSGPIKVAQFSPRELLKTLGQDDIKTSDPEVLGKASLSTQYNGSFTSARFDDLKLTLDDTSVVGNLAVRDFASQAIQFALKVDRFDADRYTSTDESKPASPPSKEDSKSLNETEIPVAALEQLNASGTIDVGELKLKGATIKDVRLKVDGPKGAPKQISLNAKAYGGQISTDTRIAPGGKPTYALNTSLSTMQMAPMLQNFVGKDYLSGLGDIKLDLSSAGTTVGDLRRGLNGDVALSFTNGAIKGFNLGQIIRQGQAALRGESLNASEPQETDFSTISFAAKIIDGILQSDELNAKSPLFRLAGNGQIDLVNETINYIASPTVVGTSKGQGGKALEELAGLTIPIKLTGSLYSPSYKLDLKTALQQKAGQELKQKLADKVLGDKAKELTGEDGEAEISEDALKAKAAEKLNKELERGLGKLFGKPKNAEPPAEEAPAQE